MAYVIKKSTPSGSLRVFARWMSIDPGIGGTGWAMWEEEKLVASSSIKPRIKGKSWEQKAAAIIDQLRDVCNNCRPMQCFIEQPFIALDGGRAEISAKRQDVVKLSILNGMIVQAIPNTHQVRVIDWKGQCPKHIFKKRIERYLSSINYRPSTTTSHELDAIGIGRHIVMKEMDYV